MSPLLMVLLLLFPAGLLSATEFETRSAPELDAMFRNTNGWIGADGAYSVPLSRNKTLWLFSDTWIGTVRDGKRIEPKMINNTIAIQKHGRMPQFYYRTNAHRTGAESFVKPEDGRGFYWLFAGTRTKAGLFFFLRQVEIVNPGSVFGFRGFSTSLAYIKNPDANPMKWRIEQIPFPFAEYAGKDSTTLGSAMMKDKGFIYVYGTCSGPDKERKGMIVARAPEKKFADFEEWRFFSNGEWKSEFQSVTSICNDAPSEASVSYWPAMKKYVLVYAHGLWGKIMLRTAPEPSGPWSEPTALYDAPEMKYPAKVFCYAGKAHPQLSKKQNELIVTYASNSYDIGEVVRDARLYVPHFIRVKLVEK